MARRFLAPSAAVLLALAASCAQAQVLQLLASAKTFTAGRASSTDPNHHNGDARRIEPGATLPLVDVHGAGSIEHFWCTIASPDPDHTRQLVLRMTWDDAATPAVVCPIADFFAEPPGHYVEYTSAPVSVGAQMALNCYWPMPFRKHAVITVTNEGSRAVDAFYYNIDYRTGDRPSGPARYFHTQYRNYFPAPTGENLTICDTTGAGHYVGTVVTVFTNSDGWWGEGNDQWFIDGSKDPVIEGTGSEDYFCGAWDFGHARQAPYFGVTWYDDAEHGGEKRGITNTVYRWHIPDPVPFRKSLRMMLEHGSAGWNKARKPYTNNYTTVGFYYLDNPAGDGPALPPYASRVPVLVGSSPSPVR